jgi:hypothetical protein
VRPPPSLWVGALARIAAFFALEGRLWLALRVSSRICGKQKGAVCACVSASENSVPRSGGDWFDDCVLGPEFGGKRPAFRLFGIEPKRLELPAPIGRWIAEPLDADAAGKAAFHGCFDKIGC